MSDEQKIRNFVELATGQYEGPEEMMTDPQAGKMMQAEGYMENVPALGGMALNSSYHQTMQGVTSILCQTLIRFLPTGEATMIWTPREGDPQIYTGKLSGPVIEVSRTDDNGMIQTIRTDYGDGSSVLNQMTMAFPGSDEAMTVFTGQYSRKDSD